MPTKTFFNLKKNKREKIEDAIIKEYSSFSYYDISIKRIITKSKIPRGSFYQYFSGKDDLIHYAYKLIIEKHKNEIHNYSNIDLISKIERGILEEYRYWKNKEVLYNNISTLSLGVCLHLDERKGNDFSICKKFDTSIDHISNKIELKDEIDANILKVVISNMLSTSFRENWNEKKLVSYSKKVIGSLVKGITI